MLPGERLNAIIAALQSPDNKFDRNEVCSFLIEAIDSENSILEISYSIIPDDEFIKREKRVRHANTLLFILQSIR